MEDVGYRAVGVIGGHRQDVGVEPDRDQVVTVEKTAGKVFHQCGCTSGNSSSTVAKCMPFCCASCW